MGEACSLHGRDQESIQNFSWKTKGMGSPKEDNIEMDMRK